MDWDPTRLRALAKRRGFYRKDLSFGKVVDNYMRRRVYPRQKKLQRIAQAWSELLPDDICQHCCLEDYSRGILKVLVDSPIYLSELNMLVREGLADHIQDLCPELPLSKIKLVHSRWYYEDEEGNKIVKF